MKKVSLLFGVGKHDNVIIQSLLLLVCAEAVFVNASTQDSCGTIGTNEGRHNRDGSTGFYLNTDNPALYSGTIRWWHYCHYLPFLTFNLPRETTIAVFRPKDDGFERVSEPTLIQEEIQQLVSIGGSFECNILQVSDPGIQVQKGDVIGACVYDFLDTSHELNIVGQNAPQDSRLLFASGLDCTVIDRLIPSNVSSSIFTQVSSRVMHLYAEIECPPVPSEPDIDVVTNNTTSTSSLSNEKPTILTQLPSTDDQSHEMSSNIYNVTNNDTNSESPSSTEPNNSTIFVLQIAGIVGGLIVGLVLLAAITVCTIIVCCTQSKTKSKKTPDNCICDNTSRTIATHNKRFGMRTLTLDRPKPKLRVKETSFHKTNRTHSTHRGHTDKRWNQESYGNASTGSGAVCTVVNNLYQETKLEESNRSSNIYSYPNLYRVESR